MNTIVIKPKSKAEENLLTRLFKKMNIDAHVVEEPMAGYETSPTMVNETTKKSIKSKASEKHTDKHWAKLSEAQKNGIFDAIKQLDEGKGVSSEVVFEKYRNKFHHA